MNAHVPNVRRACLVGPFPPPVNGLSTVNALVRDALQSDGVLPIVIDTSPSSASRALPNRLRRSTRVFVVVAEFIRCALRGEPISLYLSVSGGLGQFYEILSAFMARVLRWRLVLHHHSYEYLDKRRWRTRLLTWIAGDRAVHVALCKHMASQLQSLYASAKQVHVLSNAALIRVDGAGCAGPRSRLRTIGFLGNVSVEKGIMEVLSVGRRLADVGAGVPVLVAGPFSNPGVENVVAEAAGGCKEIRYVGPRYDADKTHFLESIDVLLFPSQYVHEAEPLTVYEALARGVPVIALRRGCLTEVMNDACGMLIESPDSYVDQAVGQILRWRAHPHLFEEASQRASDCFRRLAGTYSVRFQELLDMIAG